MESALWPKALDVHQQHERQFKELQEDYCEVMLELRKREYSGPVGRGRGKACATSG